MSDMASKNKKCKRSVETAAYIDGELDARALRSFDEHLQECSCCSDELNEQRRLICALDSALGADDPFIELPCDFSLIVATNAESDMSGVRKRAENGRALRLCIGLALAAFGLLGGATLFAAVSVPVRVFVRTSASIFGFAWHALYDSGVGAAVIMRPLGRRLIFESHLISLIAVFLFAFALALLPRLIYRYHRIQITE